MAGNYSNNEKKNVGTSLLCQLFTLLCGLIIPKLMIQTFGSEAYGAVTSITQFLAYIALLEGGIGGVARSALYKPLARGDMNTISAITSEVQSFFRIIACLFVVYTLGLAVSFQQLSSLACMDWISTFVLVIVISFSTFGQYYFGITNAILLQADRRVYVSNVLNICTTVINAISVIALVKMNCSLITVKLVSSMIYFIRPLSLLLYVKNNYAISYMAVRKERKYLAQKWIGLAQHIAFFLHSNTDIVVLTLLANLRMVAVYGVYNMLISHMQSLVVSFTSGMEAVFGHLLAKDKMNELNKSFSSYEIIISIVSAVLYSVTAILIIPFVKLYTQGITDVNYVEPLFAVILIATSLCYCTRTPYHAVIVAAGHFKQTSIAAYGEVILNITLSIILVSEYGLVGVAMGTLVATLFRFIYYVWYLSKYIIIRPISLFMKHMLVNSGVFFGCMILGQMIVSDIAVDSYMKWVICGSVSVAAVTIIAIGMNLIFFYNETIGIIKNSLKII